MKTSKLKLGAIADDKPVRLTVEIPAALHRDLVDYAQVLGQGDGTVDFRTGKADRPYAGAVHGDRSDVRKDAARGSSCQ